MLIDEIELHLHPSMQRQIVNKLHSMCPNIQFIITTHSPLVALSAMDVAQVLTLDGKGEVNDTIEETVYANYDINQMLLSPLFAIPSVRAMKWDEIITKRKHILSKTEKLTDEEKQQLANLNQRILSLNVPQSSKLPEIRNLLEKLAEMI